MQLFIRKCFELGTTTLVFSNEDLNDIMKVIVKIVKSLEESSLLRKGISKTIKYMLLGTLGASLLGNLLTGKGTSRAGQGTIKAGEGKIITGQDF